VQVELSRSHSILLNDVTTCHKKECRLGLRSSIRFRTLFSSLSPAMAGISHEVVDADEWSSIEQVVSRMTAWHVVNICDLTFEGAIKNVLKNSFILY
jgi:hypothetical protein